MHSKAMLERLGFIYTHTEGWGPLNPSTSFLPKRTVQPRLRHEAEHPMRIAR